MLSGPFQILTQLLIIQDLFEKEFNCCYIPRCCEARSVALQKFPQINFLDKEHEKKEHKRNVCGFFKINI